MALRRRDQIAEGLSVAPPDPTPHLVQIGQAEVLGLVDQNGIGIGDVQSVLHNGRADQHIEASFHEAQEQLFQFLSLHLTVPYGHPCIWYDPLDHARHFSDVLHPVVYEEDLSATFEFEGNGIPDPGLIKGDELGVDRLAIGRWRGHDAEVTCGHQGKLQGPRDGSGR